METYDVIIIGAGPAGLMAAVKISDAGAKVLVLEKMNRAGKKLLITGNGRCNITNAAPVADFIKKVYPNGRFLKHAFSQFFNKDIVAFLENSGLETKVEEKGKVYPVSDKAGDVLSVFLNKLHRNKTEIKYNCMLTDFFLEGNEIQYVKFINDNIEQTARAKYFILATGGMSYPTTGSTGDGYIFARKMGHHIISTRPSLVPLVTKGETAKNLQGLSLKNVKVCLWINNKKQNQGVGEVLFTHYGLSGPLIHSLSRDAVEAIENGMIVELSIDFLPELDERETDKKLLNDINENGKKCIDNLMKLWLSPKLVTEFLRKCEIKGQKEAHQLSAEERRKIRILIKDFRLSVIGHRSFKEAIITAGGVSTAEIDGKTMQSKIIENLYFAGEIIDLDGDTGGYNLQIAYSTGWLAGISCCNKLKL